MCGCVIESVSTNSGIEVTEAPIVSQDSYHLKIPPKIYEKREKRNIQLLTQDTKGKHKVMSQNTRTIGYGKTFVGLLCKRERQRGEQNYRQKCTFWITDSKL